jgi:hypothetical protein
MMASPQDLTAGWPRQHGDHLHQRALARAVMADHPEQPAFQALVFPEEVMFDFHNEGFAVWQGSVFATVGRNAVTECVKVEKLTTRE